MKFSMKLPSISLSDKSLFSASEPSDSSDHGFFFLPPFFFGDFFSAEDFFSAFGAVNETLYQNHLLSICKNIAIKGRFFQACLNTCTHNIEKTNRVSADKLKKEIISNAY